MKSDLTLKDVLNLVSLERPKEKLLRRDLQPYSKVSHDISLKRGVLVRGETLFSPSE